MILNLYFGELAFLKSPEYISAPPDSPEYLAKTHRISKKKTARLEKKCPYRASQNFPLQADKKKLPVQTGKKNTGTLADPLLKAIHWHCATRLFGRLMQLMFEAE